MTPSPTLTVPDGESPFPELVATADDGRLLEDLNQQVVNVVAALVAAHEKSGGKPKASLSLDVRFKLENGRIWIEAQAKTKLPKSEPAAALFYPTKDFTLARNDPKQRDLFRDEAPKSAPEPLAVRRIS